MSRSRIVSLLATVAMLGTGAGSMMGCAAHAQVAVQPPPVPEVVAPPPPPAAVVVAAPPPAPRLMTVCDAVILPVGGHLKFPHEVEFDEGKDTIKNTETTTKILQCLVDFLATNPMVTKFRIDGHTDNRGDAALNLKLSEARALAIVTWLTAHGVNSAKLESKGYGSTRPVPGVPNDTPENMAKNRRVEFHIEELNGVKATKESVALAMNPPPAVVVTSVAVPAPPPVVGVAVVPAAQTVGVQVAVPAVSGGVSVATPSVSIGVGIGGGAAAAGGKPAAAAKPAPAVKKAAPPAPEKKKTTTP